MTIKFDELEVVNFAIYSEIVVMIYAYVYPVSDYFLMIPSKVLTF